MSRFIRLTLISSGKPIFINPAHIVFMGPFKNGSLLTLVPTELDGSVGTRETPDQIMAMIEGDGADTNHQLQDKLALISDVALHYLDNGRSPFSEATLRIAVEESKALLKKIQS